ncbi:flagellar hook-associated protein FlgK [bacterium]|nr:flagellar hook-associated protein FlgK [bacterium]
MSLNGALSTASSALQLFSLGLQVTGNNISNASTPGYVREQLKVYPTAPYQEGSVLVGSGAQAAGVQQVLDRFLESRIYSANTDYAASSTRYTSYTNLQSLVGELGDQDLSTSLNDFITAVQNAANQPDDPAFRNIVIQQGQLFAQDVVNLRSRINELRDSLSGQMKSLTDEANSLIDQIAQLNPQIGRLEANGLDLSEAGALRVQRLNALNRLSEIIPIRVNEQPSGAIDVFTSSDFLILSGFSQHLETVVAPTDSGVAEINVQTTSTKAPIGANGGELGGLIESRDRILNGFIDQLDQFVGSVINEFNKIYSGGEGLVGFTDVTSTNYVNDTTAALNQAGLAFSPEHGSFEIQVRDATTGASTNSKISIDLDGLGTDTSLEDLRAALDGIDHITATITSENKLQLKTDAGYEIRFQGDTSGVLAALGINTFFTGSSSDDIGINSVVANDQRYFAASQGGGPADNSNALALAQFIDQPLSQLNGLNIDDFYTNMIGTLGQSAAAEEALSKGAGGFRDSLLTQREQRSGVSIDEEAILALQYQHNYQAAARIISTVEQLFNTLLNI